MSSPVRIMGIDPGLQHTGYGIIDVHHHQTRYVSHGVIHTRAADSLSQRLFTLFAQLCDVFKTFCPQEVSVEDIFVNTNGRSTLKLGMARGVVLMAPSQYNLPVYEYSANCVKKAVVGAGHATKEQVAKMVGHLVRIPKDAQEKSVVPEHGKTLFPAGDGADALAVALCHAHFRTVTMLDKKYG